MKPLVEQLREAFRATSRKNRDRVRFTGLAVFIAGAAVLFIRHFIFPQDDYIGLYEINLLSVFIAATGFAIFSLRTKEERREIEAKQIEKYNALLAKHGKQGLKQRRILCYTGMAIGIFLIGVIQALLPKILAGLISLSILIALVNYHAKLKEPKTLSTK